MDGGERALLWAGAGVAAVTLAVAVALLVRLVRSWRALRAAGVPVSRRAVFWTSVAYLVWPVDLLLDPVYLDDIGVLLLALRSLHAAARRGREGPTGGGTRARGSGG
jgi:uncharacterized membrane protein YkvA (DUF1232 family)